VIVVGAGPAGCAAALELARGGIETLVLERYRLPRPKACAGGLSPWTLKLLDRMGLGQRVRDEAHPVRGATLWTHHGVPLRLRGSLEAAVLPRERFDWMLAQAARRAGAEVREQVQVRRLRHGLRGQALGVETAAGAELSADAVLLAAGSRSHFVRARRGSASFFGLLERFEVAGEAPAGMDLYLDREVQPHYGWLFPEGGRQVNVGLCCQVAKRQGDGRGPGNPLRLLEQLKARHLSRLLEGGRRLGRATGHPIHARWQPQRLVQTNVLRAGEAAGLVDPLTGEGIHHALLSGSLAGRALRRALGGGGDPDWRALGRYRSAVTRALLPLMALSQGAVWAGRTPAFPLALSVLGLGPLRRAGEALFSLV
jgi:geranylgeranyl reductase family protein